MGMLLRVAVERCDGCGNCEMACAFAHASDSGPGQPRITIIRDRASSARRGLPVVCLQCGDAACVAACPVGALARNAESGAIELHEATCVECRSCLAACPFGNAVWDAREGRVVKCDLCGGDPACARFCPSGALALVPAESVRAVGRPAPACPAPAGQPLTTEA